MLTWYKLSIKYTNNFKQQHCVAKILVGGLHEKCNDGRIKVLPKSALELYNNESIIVIMNNNLLN